MNKCARALLLCSLTLLALIVSCQTKQTAVTPTPSVVATTEIEIPPSATAVPTLITTPPPLPRGRILFLWDSESPPIEYGGEPKQRLYLAEPGESASEWNIEPLLNDLYGRPVAALSPDQTKLALMVLEDRDNDGAISYGSFKRGGDAPNLYIYSLTDGSFERITHNYPNSFYLSWTPDSQTITYPDGPSVFSYDLTTQSIQQLSGDYPDGVSKVAWSPDGSHLAVDLNSGLLYFFDAKTQENVEVPGELASSPSQIITWSPDGKWLASNTLHSAGLFIVNSETLESKEVVTTNFASFPAWSPLNEKLLAYTQTEFSEDTVKDTILGLWDMETQKSSELQESIKMAKQLWSPDSKMLAVGLFNGIMAQLTLVEPDTGNLYVMLEEQNSTEYVPLVWSPDSMWLLFFSKQQENVGLYVIHRDGGEPFLLLDTTATYDPYAFVWLPTIEVP